MSEPGERVAFQDEGKEVNITKGVKLKNKRPSLAAKKMQEQQAFEKRADEYMDERQSRNKLAFDLARQFFSSLEDTVLSENKTPLNIDVENELRKNLCNLLHEIDNDENEETDSMGTVTIVALILKGMHRQRDTINKLGYKVEQLEKELSSLRKAG